MPADLKAPFGESCCDGGIMSLNSQSAQYCGCDAGANHVCERHTREREVMWNTIETEHEEPEPMTKFQKHLKEVVNVTWNANSRCETTKDHFLNAAMGLAGEASEVLDAHKKHYFHRPKDYRQAVLLEMGDTIYYWLKTQELWGFTDDEILEANKAKLFERYDVK